MKILVLTLSLFLCLMNSTASASECIEQSDMAEIASDFAQFKNISKSKYCFDGSQTSNLLATIMFMRKTAFTADMKRSSDELFSGRFSTSWYNYFVGRINDMDVQDDCPKGMGAFVYGFGNTMYVCPMLLTENFSALDRASVFMHEARHIDGYPHTTCSKGARRGLQGACDTRISDGGSYAVTVETYAQIAKYATDLHPALKAYAMASAVTYADETFEFPARVNRKNQLLLMAKSRDLFSMDLENANRIEALGQAPALGHLVFRAQHLILFPDDKTLTARYMFSKNEGEINQSAGEVALEYNAQTPEERARLVDLHIAAQWTATIYQDKVTFACDPRSPSTSSLTFKGTTAVGILYLNGYSRTAETAYIMTSTGEVYEFGCPGKKAVLRSSTMKIDQNFKRIHNIDNSVFALTHDGFLFQINGTIATPVKTGLDGQIHEIAPKQSYQFLDAAITID